MTRAQTCFLLAAMLPLVFTGTVCAQSFAAEGDVVVQQLMPDETVDDGGYVDLDNWLYQQQCDSGCDCPPKLGDAWTWQLLPVGVLYKSYLAGAHEPRLRSVGHRISGDGWSFGSTLGGRVPLLRYGTQGGCWAQGWQLDFEGAVFLRQNDLGDMIANDFRAGVPITYSRGRYRTKFGYYHVSAHLGDEFLLDTGAPRINYVRDVFNWGHSLQWTDTWRLYFEVGYAFNNDDGSEPWEFQFGAEYSTIHATGSRGAPFAALNGHLREEVDFGGNFVAQAGWQWRSQYYGPLLRVGIHYYNGMSSLFEFFDQFERQFGVGIWYDF